MKSLRFPLGLLLFAAVAAAVSAVFAAEPGKYGPGTSAQFRGPVGLQIYSLRSVSAENPEKALQMAQAYGFYEVEYSGSYGMNVADYAALLRKYELHAISGHWDYNLFKENPEQIAREAKTLGLERVGVAWIPHNGDFDEQECREAADVLNRAGAILAKEGIGVYIHNHGYEFQPYKDGTLFDLLMELTDPNFVSVQLDILWTIFPGQDPVAIMKKYPTRISSLHLKDLKKGVQGDMTGGTDVANDVALCSGQADYASILQTAQEIGVRHYFIEDESPVFETQIEKSLRNLEKVEW